MIRSLRFADTHERSVSMAASCSLRLDISGRCRSMDKKKSPASGDDHMPSSVFVAVFLRVIACCRFQARRENNGRRREPDLRFLPSAVG